MGRFSLALQPSEECNGSQDADAERFVSFLAADVVALGGDPTGTGELPPELLTVAYWEEYFLTQEYRDDIWTFTPARPDSGLSDGLFAVYRNMNGDWRVVGVDWPNGEPP